MSGDDARSVVLSRIRAAIGDSTDVPVARHYRQAGDHAPGSAEALDLLVDRLIDYRAEVVRCGDGDTAIAAAVSGVLAARGTTGQIVTAPGVPAGWFSGPQRRDDDPPLSVTELDQVGGVLTGSSVAIAETGTIVLVADDVTGRRAISLVPDLHLCVVRAAAVVHSVPEGLARLDPTGPLTFISGPSATSDIELNRVEGVHGPRTLVVILAGAETPASTETPGGTETSTGTETPAGPEG